MRKVMFGIFRMGIKTEVTEKNWIEEQAGKFVDRKIEAMNQKLKFSSIENYKPCPNVVGKTKGE